MKILVVEDHPIDMKLAVHVLSEAGHDVSSAGAADRALEEIRESRPDIVLLDLSLPGMDGLSLARKLKADPDLRVIPIVAITSYPESFSQETAIDAGCDGYLQKPVSTRELPGVLSALVESKTE